MLQALLKRYQNIYSLLLELDGRIFPSFFSFNKKKIEDNTILINSIIKVFKFFSAIFAGFNKQFGRYYIRTEPFKALVQNLLYYREIV